MASFCNIIKFWIQFYTNEIMLTTCLGSNICPYLHIPLVYNVSIAVISYTLYDFTWWRHQMETFSALLVLCARNSLVTNEFPTQRPLTLSFDVFFDLLLNKRLSKQSCGWWFETPLHPWWCQSNDMFIHHLWKITNHTTQTSIGNLIVTGLVHH